MKYRPEVNTILLKKLKTNILHIIELIGIKMYHVLKPHWFENDNIKTAIVDQTQKIGFIGFICLMEV